MHHVIRIHAIISPIRERRTEWVYIKYLDASFTHGPSSICVVKLNPLKKRKRVLLTNHYSKHAVIDLRRKQDSWFCAQDVPQWRLLKNYWKHFSFIISLGNFCDGFFYDFRGCNLMPQSWRPPYVPNSGSWPIRLVSSRCTCLRQTFTEKYQIITTNFHWVLRLACRESWYLNLVLKRFMKYNYHGSLSVFLICKGAF